MVILMKIKCLAYVCILSLIVVLALSSGCSPSQSHLQEKTGELYISCIGTDYSSLYETAHLGTPNQISKAVEKFQELYPEINLKFERVDFTDPQGFSAYYDKLATEVMSGRGPDVFWISSSFDIPKMMQAGVFADMKFYFESDSDFHKEEYNNEILYGGQPDGKQYLIPINYSVPFFITEQSTIDKMGISIDRDNYKALAEKIMKGITEFHGSGSYISNINLPINFPDYSGLQFIDFNSKEITIDTSETKELYEINQHFLQNIKPTGYSMGGSGFYSQLKNGNTMFIDCTNSLDDLLLQYRLLLNDTKPVVFPWRNIDGGLSAKVAECIAVRNNSLNKRNAYNFIKIMLSPDIQTLSNNIFRLSIPVSNQAVENILIANTVESIEQFADVGSVKLPALSKDFIIAFKSYLSEVCLENYSNRGEIILKEEMQPYMDGESDYRQCMEKAVSKLEIYMSE